MVVHVVESGVHFPEESADEVQKQKQLLKDAAAFLVSCQIPSLVSGTDPPTDPRHTAVKFSGRRSLKTCMCAPALRPG